MFRFAAKHLLLWGMLAAASLTVWMDFEIRSDFADLQWSLPARLYARPLELFAEAEVSRAAVEAMLDELGYQAADRVSGSGQYRASAASIEIRTRGFDFWDGSEPARHVRVDFEHARVAAIQGADNTFVPLLRLEPQEIARINPSTGEDRLILAIDDVPPALVAALISIEDKRFFEHHGVDLVAIARAAYANVKAGEVVQGGSTITQQLIKNLYLDRRQNFVRKAREAVMAILLELHADKGEILEAYLNEVFLGQDGDRAIHGYGLAARHYFGRPLNELGVADLALLVGLAKGASYYNPFRHLDRAIARRDLVLREMYEGGLIDDDTLNAALEYEPRLRDAGGAGVRGYPAFVEMVRRQLNDHYDPERLRSEGLRVFTTLDLTVQKQAESALEAGLAALEGSRGEADQSLQGAVVVTNPATGDVAALIGGRDNDTGAFNRALHAARPIGSLAKPAVYLAALRRDDFNLASVLADRPVELVAADGQRWRPRNYNDTYRGDVYLWQGLAQSLNLATVDLGMRIGIDSVAQELHRLGYDAPLNAYPSLVLGAVDMSPVEVAEIYQTIASGGFRTTLRAVEAVTTATGERLNRYGIAVEQAIDPGTSYLLEYALRSVFESGTARGAARELSDRLPLAGKTGTTNDLRDSWFVGYGSNYLGVVWLGYDDNRPTGLSGSSGALRVWTRIMRGIPLRPLSTPPPQDVEWRSFSASPDADCDTPIVLPVRRGDAAESMHVCGTPRLP